MVSENVLEVRGLTKSYGRVEPLRGVDLTVGRGDVYGFLGRNGAGKSTTIRILMGITQPTGGTLTLFGEPADNDLVRWRQRIGYVAQEQNFYPWMSALQLGAFVRGFFPNWEQTEFERLLRLLDVPPDQKVRTLSGGTKVKLGLSLALAHRPALLLLDEPTAGLDPVARREFLHLLREQAARSGATTFFSTHLIDEIDLAARRVGILDAGRTRFEGPVSELSARVKQLRKPLSESTYTDASGATLPQPLPAPFDDPRTVRVLEDAPRCSSREVTTPDERRAIVEIWPGLSDDPFPYAERAGWRVEELPLEEIFVAMVRRRAEA